MMKWWPGRELKDLFTLLNIKQFSQTPIKLPSNSSAKRHGC